MTSRSKIERVDGNRGRFYRIRGVEYPSVTTVLSVIGKPALTAWAAKVEREMVIVEAGKLYDALHGQEKVSSLKWTSLLTQQLGKEKAHSKELAKAGEIGSQVHAMIEWNLKARLLKDVGPAPEIGPKAQHAYASWVEWSDKNKLKPLYVEETVYSETHQYAGTMDLLAEIDGEPVLLDWKTGKKIYDESLLQNIAYRKAVEEMGFGKPTKGIIVRLPKIEGDPEFEVREVTENPKELFSVFLSAYDLWKWCNKKVCDVQTRTADEQLSQK